MLELMADRSGALAHVLADRMQRGALELASLAVSRRGRRLRRRQGAQTGITHFAVFAVQLVFGA